ncbi:Uncharacterised protein [Vibrio cholerae]|nr:Uncharacterised protein [Vibrio cholerae]
MTRSQQAYHPSPQIIRTHRLSLSWLSSSSNKMLWPWRSRSSNCSLLTAHKKIPTATQTNTIAIGMSKYKLSTGYLPCFFSRRSELVTTIIELPDIPTTAI